jgi:hypothetical protein
MVGEMSDMCCSTDSKETAEQHMSSSDGDHQ